MKKLSADGPLCQKGLAHSLDTRPLMPTTELGRGGVDLLAQGWP